MRAISRPLQSISQKGGKWILYSQLLGLGHLIRESLSLQHVSLFSALCLMFSVLYSRLMGLVLQGPRIKLHLLKLRSNSLQTRRGMGHGSRNRALYSRSTRHDQLGKEEIGQLPESIRYRITSQFQEPFFMFLGPCGHDYHDQWGKGGKTNKKGPRSLNLGPRGFNICSLDTHYTHSQLSLSNVP